MLKPEIEQPPNRGPLDWHCGQGSSLQDWLSEGEAALTGGDLPQARHFFEQALQREPLNTKALNALSRVHWKLGDVEEALKHLTRALQWDPDDQAVILNCCSIFSAMGKTGDAKEILTAYLKRKPWDTEVERELKRLEGASAVTGQSLDAARFLTEQGEFQFEQGKIERARVCFEMALEHNPQHARAHSDLGVLCWQQGELETALEHLHRALRLDPLDLDIIYNSAQTLEAAGEWSSATQLLKMYLQKKPRDDAAWEDYRALVGKMAASSWKAEGLSPAVADVYINTGIALGDASDLMGAAEAFQRAAQVDPNRIEPYHHLGHLHQELGQLPEALEMLREALRLNPLHKETVLLMGDVLVAQGLAADARGIFLDFLNHAPAGDEQIREALNRLPCD